MWVLKWNVGQEKVGLKKKYQLFVSLEKGRNVGARLGVIWGKVRRQEQSRKRRVIEREQEEREQVSWLRKF